MKILLLNLFVLLSFTLFGQRDALMKDVSLSTCECIKNADENLGFEMMVGLCLLQGASPRAEEIEKELGLDLSNVDNYEQLGELLAPSLIDNCPEFLSLMMDAAADGSFDLEDDDDEVAPDTPATEDREVEKWSDIGSGSTQSKPAYGGPENKNFITTPLENTNGSGLSKPKVKGKIVAITEGLVNEITLSGPGKQRLVLYLDSPLQGVDKLIKGKTVELTYQEKSHFHAGEGKKVLVKVITKID